MPSRQASPDKTGDRSDRIHVRNPVQAGENEIAIQWYQPEFGKEAITTILLCALNNKGVSINDKTATFASYTTVNQLQTSDLSLNGKALKEIHDDLITLVQDAEAYLPPLQGMFQLVLGQNPPGQNPPDKIPLDKTPQTKSTIIFYIQYPLATQILNIF